MVNQDASEYGSLYKDGSYRCYLPLVKVYNVFFVIPCIYNCRNVSKVSQLSSVKSVNFSSPTYVGLEKIFVCVYLSAYVCDEIAVVEIIRLARNFAQMFLCYTKLDT